MERDFGPGELQFAEPVARAGSAGSGRWHQPDAAQDIRFLDVAPQCAAKEVPSGMVPCREAQLELALFRRRDVEMELDVFAGGTRTAWRRFIGGQAGVFERLLL